MFRQRPLGVQAVCLGALRCVTVAIDKDIALGIAVEIGSTPTVFVNGHPLPGGDPQLLEQSLEYGLDKTAPIEKALRSSSSFSRRSPCSGNVPSAFRRCASATSDVPDYSVSMVHKAPSVK
jgi:hypothetical protein